ncbi:hypothetical protein FOMPIDRAFT_1051763 [Fomitopsis schrenkii]|uniref:Uncharacterized protein n=1 Tax=Fomitopsis schrenkii TaxID=2126942 RepID=S8DZ10_FOMSC|nr:hypothetical protein FOMPIDRAFT_1051763 [Fomitopsis schrenkii]
MSRPATLWVLDDDAPERVPHMPAQSTSPLPAWTFVLHGMDPAPCIDHARMLDAHLVRVDDHLGDLSTCAKWCGA